MERRVLRSLKFVIEPRREYGRPSAVVVGPGSEWRVFGSDKPLCDVEAGDFVVCRIFLHRVTAVVIRDADPADQIGRVVSSGRAWLGGE